jgi:hypothetical protein
MAKRTYRETVVEMIERLSMPITECGCYAWLGGHSRGYAKMRWYENGERKSARVARYLCEPVPDGLEPDHTCRQRWCVNRDHLELVTHQENIRRHWAGIVLPEFCDKHPEERRKPVGKRGQLMCPICKCENLAAWKLEQRRKNGLPPPRSYVRKQRTT